MLFFYLLDNSLSLLLICLYTTSYQYVHLFSEAFLLFTFTNIRDGTSHVQWRYFENFVNHVTVCKVILI